MGKARRRRRLQRCEECRGYFYPWNYKSKFCNRICASLNSGRKRLSWSRLSSIQRNVLMYLDSESDWIYLRYIPAAQSLNIQRFVEYKRDENTNDIFVRLSRDGRTLIDKVRRSAYV